MIWIVQVLEEVVKKVLSYDCTLMLIDAIHIVSPLYPQIGKFSIIPDWSKIVLVSHFGHFRDLL